MCNLSNEVPQLFDWNQETNQPADRWQRAELNSSVVEFVAPTEYMVSLESKSFDEGRRRTSFGLTIILPLSSVDAGSTSSTSVLRLLDRLLRGCRQDWFVLIFVRRVQARLALSFADPLLPLD